jgi:hypothetical protein
MNVHKICLACLGFIGLLLAGCNKGGDVFLYKGDLLPVTLKGYNGSNQTLEAKIDTFLLTIMGGNATFNSGKPYLFSGNEDSVKLRVYEQATGKTVLERIIRKREKAVTISFFYMDGELGEMPEKPEAQNGKIRITWLFKPTKTNYSEPVDIAIGKYYFTPKVFEEMARVKNVKPNEFSEVVTLPAPFFTSPGLYNGQSTSIVFRAYIYKAGTNEFYTQGTGYTWDASSTIPVPSAATASSKLYIFNENFSGTPVRFGKLLEL